MSEFSDSEDDSLVGRLKTTAGSSSVDGDSDREWTPESTHSGEGEGGAALKDDRSLTPDSEDEDAALFATIDATVSDKGGSDAGDIDDIELRRKQQGKKKPRRRGKVSN